MEKRVPASVITPMNMRRDIPVDSKACLYRYLQPEYKFVSKDICELPEKLYKG
jgi:hypothetical protein